MKTYGVAIVGPGNVAKAHLTSISDTDRAELVAV